MSLEENRLYDIEPDKTYGKGKRINPKLFIIPGILIVAAILVAILVPRIYYSGRWYANTYIADENVSGMTLNQSKIALHKIYNNYKLEVKGKDDGRLTVRRDDIDYIINIDETIKEAFERQHSDFSLFDLFGKKNVSINPIVSYDKDKLKKLIKNSDIVKGSKNYKITKPVNATVSYSKDKRSYEIVKEVDGNKIIRKNLLKAVEKALDEGLECIDISDASKYGNVYKMPKITSDSKEIKKEIKAMNSAVMRWVKWKIADGVTEKAGPDLISKWISYKNGSVNYDIQAMRDWMEELCLKYKTLGGTRTFKSHTGQDVQISGGDYGWRLDYDQMISQLENALKKKLKSSLQDAYIKDPSSANKKPLIINKKAVYSGTAYTQNFDDKMKDFDENNYTEVSIAEQMVYVIRDGKVAFSTKCITGLPSDPERATKTGVYFIKEHKPVAILKGETYRTKVHDWVRISWTGTGFHEAHWQPWGSWTKEMYQSRGSHGCVNLSPQDAHTIFNMLKYKEAVFIH